jgi:putative copper export protein
MIIAGLILLIGTIVSRLLIRPLIIEEQRLTVIDGWWRRLPGLVAWFILVASLGRGMLQVMSFVDPGEAISGELIRAALVDSAWGVAWMLQTAAAFALLGLSWRLMNNPRGQYRMATVLMFVLVVAQSGMGHGVDQVWPLAWLGRMVHSIHLLAAGLWLGTLAIMAMAIIPNLHGMTLARVIVRFSVAARSGAAAIVITGLISTVTYVRTVDDLVNTAWGRLLAIKLVLLLGVLAVGWWNWRVITPTLTLQSESSVGGLRRAVAIELALGVAMLIATAYLVGTSLPVDLG